MNITIEMILYFTALRLKCFRCTTEHERWITKSKHCSPKSNTRTLH